MSASVQAYVVALTIPCLAFFVVLVRTGRLRAKYAMIWLPFVTVMAVVAIIPSLGDLVARLAGISYPPTLFLSAAVALLVVVNMHYAWELSRLEERVRSLAEEIALRDVSPDVRDESPSP